jgi:hypothetical protein
MRKHRTRRWPQATLADGYQSIPALKVPKSEEEIAAIVRDERAERERKRIEQDAKAEHVARAVAKLRDQGR